MMLPPDVVDWVESLTGTPVNEQQPCSGGNNNQSWVLRCAGEYYFFKQYYGDAAKRYERETNFLELLNAKGIKYVPRLIGKKESIQGVLCSFISGSQPCVVTPDLILQCAHFIAALNEGESRSEEHKVIMAKGAMCSGEDFVSDVNSRMAAFLALKPSSEVEKEFADFLHQELQPCQSALLEHCDTHNVNGWHFRLLLSPSDFGFHNTLLTEQVNFIDFEYAGWDSAEKLVTDFFAQPRYDVNAGLMQDFVETIMGKGGAGVTLEHCRVLLPVAHFKWALIFLNDFLAAGRKRRSFSLSGYKGLEQQRVQLDKAKIRVDRLKKMFGELF